MSTLQDVCITHMTYLAILPERMPHNMRDIQLQETAQMSLDPFPFCGGVGQGQGESEKVHVGRHLLSKQAESHTHCALKCVLCGCV